MLFSLVLLAASKEVELWQAFDEFAPAVLPRELQMSTEFDSEEDPESVEGDEGEKMEGDEAGEEGASDEIESDGNDFPLVPVAAAGAAVVVGALVYNFAFKGGKDEPENENSLEEFVENVKQGEPTAVAIMATVTTVGSALVYKMVTSGGQSGQVQTASSLDIVTNNPGKVVAALLSTVTVGCSVFRVANGHWPFLKTKEQILEAAQKDLEAAETKREAADTKYKTLLNNRTHEVALGAASEDEKKKLNDAKTEWEDAKKAVEDAKKAVDDSKK